MNELSPPEITLNLLSKSDSGFRFHNHQLRALSSLTKFYEKQRRGVLVIPTGGGKTETAVRWILRNHVSLGGRVLWLAHRRNLLMQAMDTFHRAAREAASAPENPRDTLTLFRISSEDGSWSQVYARHDVVLATAQSTARAGSLGFVKAMAEQSAQPLFLVVDEAHHLSAPGYQAILRALEPYNIRLLGLTATPVRMDDQDKLRLWNSLGAVIDQVDKAELIEEGILSIPVPVSVKTEINFEEDLSSQDRRDMKQFGDLGQKTLDRISKHAHRNELIVRHYVENAARYQKTMVFAANIAHAVTLHEEFSKKQISVDYVTQNKGNNALVMEAFRKGQGVDVLISVEMLTEGYDAPGTKTVFLARPTQSESLFSQMIGRALRGPKVGGSREAYLVSFVDSWSQFQVLDPEYIVGLGPVEDEGPAAKPAPVELVTVEIEIILEAYRLLQSSISSASLTVHDCLPGGWYSWEEEFDDDIQTRRVLVFDHQKPFLEQIRQGKYELPDDPGAHNEYLRKLLLRVFADCPEPLPRLSDVHNLLQAQKKGVTIHSATLEQKEQFSPVRVARQLYDEDVPPRKQRERIQQIFDDSPICQAVYRADFHRFHENVQQELSEITHIRSHASLPEVVEVLPEKPALSWPNGEEGYNLCLMMRRQMAYFDQDLDIQDIRYCPRAVKGYWGQYRTRDRVILVNPRLNSPDVPMFVLEFLVYHELLHSDLPEQGHSPEFRERERAFRPSPEATQDAARLGYRESKMTDYWRVMADQILDTYHARYLTAEHEGKMRK